MTIVLGCDHAGYKTKRAIIKALADDGHTIVDIGSFSGEASDDYPDYAAEVARAVRDDTTGQTKGVLVCGSGTGMVIAANKIKGVRAAMAYDTYSAKMARIDNDANIIALRGRGVTQKNAVRYVRTFLKTQFSNKARHKRRIQKLHNLEGA